MRLRIVGYVLLGILSAIVIYSAVDKFFFSKEKTRVFAGTSFEDHIIFLGICDLFLLLLFIVPVTRRIGFIFSACYYSVALSLRINTGSPLAEPLAILFFLFVAMFVVDRSIFFMRKR